MRLKRIDADKTKLIRLQQQRVFRKMWLDGIPPVDIRKELGLSVKKYNLIEGRVWKQVEAEEAVDTNEARQFKLAQLRSLLVKANSAFGESQREYVEVTTNVATRICTACKGKCVNKQGEDCELCRASGEISVTTETKKTKKSHGDPSFMKECRACLELMTKLEGLCVPQKVEFSGQVQHQHQAISPDNKMHDVTSEKILQILAVKEESENPDDIIDVRVIGSNGRE